MSYEDLEKARAERAGKGAAKEAKKVVTAGKRKRGRKAQESGRSKVRQSQSPKLARMSEAQVEEDEIALEPWRAAPEARMW